MSLSSIDESVKIRPIGHDRMEVQAGEIRKCWTLARLAHLREFTSRHDEFVSILGANDRGEVLSFTISSQTKYLNLTPHN